MLEVLVFRGKVWYVLAGGWLFVVGGGFVGLVSWRVVYFVLRWWCLIDLRFVRLGVVGWLPVF